MSRLVIGNQTIEAPIVKIRRGEEGKAQQAASNDGLDNVFFKLGGDTYVASGRNLPLGGIAPWQEVSLNGKAGHVYKIDTGGITRANVVAGAAVGAAGMWASGTTLGLIFKAMPSLLEFGVFGLVGLGAGALTMLGAKFFSDRAARQDRLAKFGTPV